MSKLERVRAVPRRAGAPVLDSKPLAPSPPGGGGKAGARTEQGQRVSDVTSFAGISTRSSEMKDLFGVLAVVAPTDINVLIEGETGVGKGLIAECVHRSSARAAGPFVVFDCAAASALTAELELFGSESVDEDVPHAPLLGCLERAAGGTLVLDNIEGLIPHLQARLARAIKRSEATRVNGGQSFRLNLRIVAISKGPLLDGVGQGRFRYDLYLCVANLALRVPALRDRIEDLSLIADELLSRYQPPRTLCSFPTEVQRELAARPWPGNIRELHHALARLVTLTTERS